MKKNTVTTSLDLALTGQFAHPDPIAAVSSLSVEAAGRRPEGAPRTVHEIVGHLVYWQAVTLDWIDGKEPEMPSDPEVPWPAGPVPESLEAWEAQVERFAEGIQHARRITAEGDLEAPMAGMEEATVLGTLQVMASHNSYHLGQIVLLRRLLGEWGGR